MFNQTYGEGNTDQEAERKDEGASVEEVSPNEKEGASRVAVSPKEAAGVPKETGE